MRIRKYILALVVLPFATCKDRPHDDLLFEPNHSSIEPEVLGLVTNYQLAVVRKSSSIWKNPRYKIYSFSDTGNYQIYYESVPRLNNQDSSIYYEDSVKIIKRHHSEAQDLFDLMKKWGVFYFPTEDELHQECELRPITDRGKTSFIFVQNKKIRKIEFQDINRYAKECDYVDEWKRIAKFDSLFEHNWLDKDREAVY